MVVRNSRRGFLTLEYAMLIVILVIALISMFFYTQRSLCSKWREAADTFGHGKQYSPVKTSVISGGG